MFDVRVGGELLSLHGALGDISWETVHDAGPSGPYQANVDVYLDTESATPSWLRRGAPAVIYDGLTRVFAGINAEPERGAPWRLSFRGLCREGSRYLAQTSTGAPTTNPQVALVQAVADGLPWTGDLTVLGTTALTTTATNLNTLEELLTEAAKAKGVRWGVDEFGRFYTSPGATTARWVADPPDLVVGTADEQYLSHLVGSYASAVAGDPPEKTATGYVTASSAAAAGKWGRAVARVALDDLGLLSAAQAQANIDGRFALVGGRMGYTNGFDFLPGEVTAIGGAPSRVGQVKAGQMIRLAGVVDTNAQVIPGASVDVLIGKVTNAVRADGTQTQQRVDPVGLVDRSFDTALEDAQAPNVPEVEEVLTA